MKNGPFPDDKHDGLAQQKRGDDAVVSVDRLIPGHPIDVLPHIRPGLFVKNLSKFLPGLGRRDRYNSFDLTG